MVVWREDLGSNRNSTGMVLRKNFLLTLVRHGETEFNRRGIIQGQTVETLETALNRTGRAQARALGRWLSDEEYTHVFSSDQERAKETCQIILSENTSWNAKSKQKDSGMSIVLDQRVRERCYGIMEGRERSEYLELAKSAGTSFQNFVPDGAETLSEVGERADNFFRDLCHICYDYQTKFEDDDLCTIPNVLVVSHGRLLATLMAKFSEKYGCSFPSGKLGNVSVNTGRSCFVVEFTKHFVVPSSKCDQHKAISMKCTSLANGDHLKAGNEPSISESS